MDTEVRGWTAHVEVVRDAPPAGQAVFVPVDRSGSPNQINAGVLEHLGLTAAFIPGAPELESGYHILPLEWQSVCFVVATGVPGDWGLLKSNLTRCLSDGRLAEVRSMWLPLMGAARDDGALGESLAATIAALVESGAVQKDGATIVIAPPAGTGDTVLGFLQATLKHFADPVAAPINDPTLPIGLDDEATGVLQVAARLNGARSENNELVTTTRLVFALAESRNDAAPDVLRKSLAAGAFASALRELAGDAYRVAWDTYFRPGFVFGTPQTGWSTAEPPALSENVAKVIDAARDSARVSGRRSAGVEDLVVALTGYERGRFSLALSAMGVEVDALQTEFYRRLLASMPQPEDQPTVRFALLNDLATAIDGLDHDRYARAIASFLVHPSTSGPISVSVQAPWGAGKSSLMRQVRAILDPAEVKRLEDASRAGETRTVGALHERLTLGGVLAFLDRARRGASVKRTAAERDQRWTVWFNAWKYESSEQVWAGLVDAIVTQISDRLDPIERELFLLRMNLARIDDGVVRRKIYERVVTFWWGRVRRWALTAAAAIASLLGLALVFHGGPPLLAALATQIGASVYLVAEYFRSRAKVASEPAKFSLAEYLRVPDYSKSVGVVHQIHEDLRRVLRVLPVRAADGETPAPLVIFIDDLDRCSPSKVATVVEGVNMFLASDLYECMFVIGMDPQMVAAALEQAHKDVRDRLPAYEKSVPLGWRFMDKFVQLPFTIPQSESDGITAFVRSLMPEAVAPSTPSAAGTGNGAVRAPAPFAGSTGDGARAAPSGVVALLQRLRLRPAPRRLPPEGATKPDQAPQPEVRARRSPAAVKAWVQEEMSRRLTDDSAEVRQMMLAMAADFSTNPREIKRLLNMVRFYLLLRIGRKAHGKAVPELDQYQRWIMLSLRWPDMMRWLQWGAVQMPADHADAKDLSTVAGRLRRLEDHAGACADFAAWRGGIAAKLGIVADGISWIDDANLLAFFKNEASLAEPARRLSAGAKFGFY